MGSYTGFLILSIIICCHSSVLRAAVAAPVPGAPTADAANSRIQTLFVPRAKIDVDDNNVVLPLCKGRLRGSRNTTILYIVIDASTAAAAEAWGANLAPPLAAAAASRAAQNASAAGGMPTCAGGNLEFAATVDFAAGNRSVTPGPTAFPPSSFSPGPKALPGYSPLAAVGGVVLNAPHVGVLQGDKLVGQAGRVVRFNQGYTKVVLATTHGYAQVGAGAAALNCRHAQRAVRGGGCSLDVFALKQSLARRAPSRAACSRPVGLDLQLPSPAAPAHDPPDWPPRRCPLPPSLSPVAHQIPPAPNPSPHLTSPPCEQGREVIYLSTDASDPLAAALENVPLAPAIGATPPAALAGLVAFTNGATGAENMQRQGLASAIKDGLSPLNVLQSFPGQVGRRAAACRRRRQAICRPKAAAGGNEWSDQNLLLRHRDALCACRNAERRHQRRRSPPDCCVP
jgi:hypothetical protein